MKFFEFVDRRYRNAGTLCAALTLTIVAATMFAPAEVAAQGGCGAEGQRPCKVWERIPSCDRGLRENFKLNMCVGSKTQIDAKTGKYIPRRDTKPTWLEFCNRSSRPMIYVAAAFWSGGEEYGWVSEGWMKIASEKCHKFDLGDDYSGAVYVYASAPDGTVWDSDDAQFCIKSYDAFNIDNSDRLECRSREYAIVGMKKVTVNAGSNIWNFGN